MSLGIMGASAAFAQAAGRAGKGEPVGKIILDTQFADPTITSISCTGDIKVSSIKNGAPLVETYSDLEEETLAIQADANTQIVIFGAEITGFELEDDVNFTKILVNNTAITTLSCNSNYALTSLDLSNNTALTALNCSNNYTLTSLDLSKNIALTTLSCNSNYALTSLDLSKNIALTTLSCGDCRALTSLDLSKNTALATLNCAECCALTALDLSKNTALATLNCNTCYALTALDLSKNTAITSLNCSDCTKLVSISYPAANSDVSTAIAGAITNATADDGTVYTDSVAAYYSTIATAATTKGWTIAQLQ